MSNIQQRKNLPKNFGAPNLGQNWAQIRFFVIFSGLIQRFFCKLYNMMAWTNAQLLVEIKNTKKKWGRKCGSNGPKPGPRLNFCHFSKFGLLVFLKIAQDSNLELCLTTIRGKTHEKNFGCPNVGQTGQNRARNQVFRYFLKFGSLALL